MKLVALWVENYMGIKGQWFNFGSSMTFDFSFNKEKRELFVSAIETPEYFDLFVNKSIVNITGVIGINGAGKTTLLKLLNVLEAKKPLIHSVVLIFEDANGKIKIFSYPKVKKEFSLKVTLPEKGLVSQEEEKAERLSISYTDDPFSASSILYYSNLYSDQNDKYLSMKNELNRSVDYQTRISLHPDRIREYLKNHDKQVNDRNLLAEESFNILRLYKSDRLRRLFTFIHDIKTKHKDITYVIERVKFPNNITIWFNEEIYRNAEELTSHSLYDFKKLLNIFSFCQEQIKKEKDDKLKFKKEVILKCFFYAFYNDSFKQSTKKIPLLALENAIQEAILDPGIFDNLFEIMLMHKSTSEFFTINKLHGVLRNLDEDLKRISIKAEMDFLERYAYSIDMGDDFWPLFNRLLSIGYTDDNSLIKYSWIDLSAGEEAILNQLSEYYYAFSKIKKKNVFVTIDEGELFLHPEWQRQYVNMLYKYFEYFSTRLEVENVKFQFIITSHSPFIAADIPKYNLIFLERDLLGFCKVSKAVDHKATFGGNIFDLFADGFFVSEFISDFAFHKINEAFKFIRDGQANEFNSLNEVELFAKSIGEPIIREELQKLIDRSKMQNFNNYYEVVKSAEKKIDVESKKKPKK